MGQDFWKEKHQFFWFDILFQQASTWKETYFAIRKILQNLESFTVFQSGWNKGVKLWAFDEYSGGAFPNNVTLDIYFTDEVVVVQCDVSDVKTANLLSLIIGEGVNKMHQGEIINDLEGFFSQKSKE